MLRILVTAFLGGIVLSFAGFAFSAVAGAIRACRSPSLS